MLGISFKYNQDITETKTSELCFKLSDICLNKDHFYSLRMYNGVKTHTTLTFGTVYIYNLQMITKWKSESIKTKEQTHRAGEGSCNNGTWLALKHLTALWIAFTCPSGVSSLTVQDFAALTRKANVFNDHLNESLRLYWNKFRLL